MKYVAIRPPEEINSETELNFSASYSFSWVQSLSPLDNNLAVI